LNCPLKYYKYLMYHFDSSSDRAPRIIEHFRFLPNNYNQSDREPTVLHCHAHTCTVRTHIYSHTHTLHARIYAHKYTQAHAQSHAYNVLYGAVVHKKSSGNGVPKPAPAAMVL